MCMHGATSSGTRKFPFGERGTRTRICDVMGWREEWGRGEVIWRYVLYYQYHGVLVTLTLALLGVGVSVGVVLRSKK